MFQFLKSSVDRVLSRDNVYYYEGERFKVTRHEFAPVTLKVRGENHFFEVDLVPAFEFNFK